MLPNVYIHTKTVLTGKTCEPAEFSYMFNSFNWSTQLNGRCNKNQ